jgi:hypothetical protein
VASPTTSDFAFVNRGALLRGEAVRTTWEGWVSDRGDWENIQKKEKQKTTKKPLYRRPSSIMCTRRDDFRRLVQQSGIFRAYVLTNLKRKSEKRKEKEKWRNAHQSTRTGVGFEE